MEDCLTSLIDDDDSMIKYFREKIIGRPVISSGADDSFQQISSIQTNDRQEKNDQVEKIINNSTRRPISASSPIVIPKRPTRSNTSSQSSVADQMSSLGEFSSSSRRDAEDAMSIILPSLPSTGHQLQHRAAFDRISVKNKSRKPLKQKLSAVKESDDQRNNLFATESDEALSSTPDDDTTTTFAMPSEVKSQQPVIEVSSIEMARPRSRHSTRSRDRSEGNLLTVNETNSSPAAALASVLQRSLSLKRTQDVSTTNTNRRSLLPMKSELETKDSPVVHNYSSRDPSSDREHFVETMSSSSSQEHIYDNLDMFRNRKKSVSPKPNDDSKPPLCDVKTREHLKGSSRLRPVTVHIPDVNETSSTTNEFEQIFNQLKKRGSIRRTHPTDELPADKMPVEEVVKPVEIEPSKPIETTVLIPPAPNRRKTLAGMQLSSTNKVATDDSKPSPSWVDIAKQKQNKFQTGNDETKTAAEIPTALPVLRKPSPKPDVATSRKSLYDTSDTPAVERDSIRALKTGNPNRINTLIKFFDK